MIEWADATSYSKSDTDRSVPRTWHARIGSFRLSVHRHIHYEKDRWLASTVPQLFSCHMLEARDVDAAKLEAIALLRSECQRVIEEIDSP